MSDSTTIDLPLGVEPGTVAQVELVKKFPTPFSNAIATARTCYSGKGIVADEQINLEAGGRDIKIAQSIYQAGHHTTFQHAQFQFAISNVSRHFIWSFLHSHPFYNSEQVSQRYVKLKQSAFYIPPLKARAKALYLDTIQLQMDAYNSLRDSLFAVAEAEYFRIFPARGKRPDDFKRTIIKKTQEAARYVAPIASLAYLYHTISGITLMRYYRVCRAADVPREQHQVVHAMVQAVLDHDPSYRAVLEQPLTPGDFTEFGFTDQAGSRQFAAEFDDAMDGMTALLVDYKAKGEETLASAVREVLGLPASQLGDTEAIELAMAPERNRLLGESLNLTTHGKLTRAMHHPAYTFRKRLSHTADSQEQRHRMTPGSRPVLANQLSDEPDYITPKIIAADQPSYAKYTATMERTWESIAELKGLGVSAEYAHYLLPNAVTVRFTESSDLLNLHHKHRMRLCYNAQEEIWQSSVEEARQILAVHPRIGAHLLPPCGHRFASGTRPICPEGDRYCGVPVWKLGLGEYERLL